MKKLLSIIVLSTSIMCTSCNNATIQDGEKIYNNLKASIANALREVEAAATINEIIAINDIYDSSLRIDSIYISFTDSLDRLDTFRFYYDTNLESFLDELKNKTFSFTELRYVSSMTTPLVRDQDHILTKDQFKQRYPGYFFRYATYRSTVMIGNYTCGFSGMSVDENETYHSVSNAYYNVMDNKFEDPKEGQFVTLSSTIQSGSNMWALANYMYKANNN